MPTGPAITRSMAVAGRPVGELTVWLGEPGLPVPRDEAAIAAVHCGAATAEQVAHLLRHMADETTFRAPWPLPNARS